MRSRSGVAEVGELPGEVVVRLETGWGDLAVGQPGEAMAEGVVTDGWITYTDSRAPPASSSKKAASPTG